MYEGLHILMQPFVTLLCTFNMALIYSYYFEALHIARFYR